MTDRLWKPREVADYLGVDRHTLYKRFQKYRETKGKEGMYHERVGVRGIRVPDWAVQAARKSVTKEG